MGWGGEGSWVGKEHPRPRERPVGVPRGQNELGMSEDSGTLCTGWAGAHGGVSCSFISLAVWFCLSVCLKD